MGRVRLIEVLGSLYNIPGDEADIERAEQQRNQISAAIERDPELRAMVAKLESHYEARTGRGKEEEMPRLPPEVEKFLRELDRRLREG